MAATHANKLFRHDEVARIVGPDEIDVISPVSAAYGLAIILDSDLAVVDYVQKDEAPRKLQSDELALIATDELLRVSYLSGVPNVNGNKEVGIQIDRLTEEDGISGKERTIRGKIVLEFRIDRYNRKIANRLHALMKDNDSDRLTKKEFLKSFVEDTKDNIADFVQNFIDENGYPKGGAKFKARGRASLSPTLEEYGVEFRNILCNVDRRSNLARMLWPSFQYDSRWLVGAKLAIPIVTTTVSILFTAYVTGVFAPPAPLPVITIGEHTNGTVSITGDNCQTGQMCDVSRGGSVTVSATPVSSDYKLGGWNCIGCTSELGNNNPVSINGVMDDLRITPVFEPLATVRVQPSDPVLGRVSCEINGVAGTSCKGTAGEVIVLEANKRVRNDSDSFVSQFVGWDCPDAWCAGVDLDSRVILLTVPERDSPDNLNVSANFRQDRLIKLSINSAEPSDAGIGSPVVTGCSPPRCVRTREGITDVYTFQQSSESLSPLSLTLSAPMPDATTSNYTFDSWMCNGGLCSRLDNPENPRTSISLNDDVTITPTYAEQIVITIQNRAVGGEVEYAESLPQNCSQMSNSTRCRFPVEGFDGLPLNIVAQPSNSNDFTFDKWLCEGNWCSEREIEGETFRAIVDNSLILTPVFTEIERTELILQTVSGQSQAEADCSPNCAGETGWETRVVARQQGSEVFKRWECLSGSSSCPSGAALTNPAIILTLNHDVTLRPIYGDPPTLTLNFNDTEGAAISCTPSDCSVTEDGTISFSLDVNSLPNTLQFRQWICSSAPDNHCREIENRFRSSTRIRVRDLSSDVIVTLTPSFDQVQVASLRIGSPADGGGSAEADCRSDCVREVPWSTSITATPDEGYEFREWVCVEGSCPTGSLSQNPTRFDINEDTKLEPSFRMVSKSTVSLTLGNPSNGGISTTCGSDCSREPGWRTSVTATPDSGYRFVRWQCSGSCPGSSAGNAVSLTINEDTNIVPIFASTTPETMVTLTVGTTSGGRATADCSSDCSGEPGWSTSVTANPDSGYRFVRWQCTGSCPGGTGPTVNLIVNQNTHITPIFEEDAEAMLTLGTSPGGSATADCGSDCSKAPGWSTSVTATPNSGYRFKEWLCTGSCPGGTGTTVNLVVSQNTHITPIFEETTQTPPPKMDVSLTFGGATGGSASAGCGSDCSKPPEWTTSVTATPDNGYRFDRWQCTGSCPTGSDSTNASISLTIDEDTHITPVFENIPPVILTIEVGEGGHVDGFAGEPQCNGPATCRYTVTEGTSISIDADPDSGYDFDRWSRRSGSSFSGSSSQISLTPNQDTTLEVTFERSMVTLTIRVGTGGHVDSFAGESQCNGPRTCTYSVPEGERVHVDADANSGYDTGSWRRISGTSYSEQSSFDIDISPTRDTELEVTFERVLICSGSNIEEVYIYGSTSISSVSLSLDRNDCTSITATGTLKERRTLRTDPTIMNIRLSNYRINDPVSGSFIAIPHSLSLSDVCDKTLYVEFNGVQTDVSFVPSCR